MNTENPSSPLDTTAVRLTVSGLMPNLLADLEALVSIPSIAFPGFRPAGTDNGSARRRVVYRASAHTGPPRPLSTLVRSRTWWWLRF